MGKRELRYAWFCGVTLGLAVIAAGCTEARGGKSYED